MALEILVSITGLFVFLLVLKTLLRREFCVLCASVSATWFLLLVLYALGYISQLVFIAVLIGESVIGVFYLVERHMKEHLKLFRLPFLLTLTLGAFALLTPLQELLYAALFLAAVWGTFLVIYACRNKDAVGRMIKHIIICCRNW